MMNGEKSGYLKIMARKAKAEAEKKEKMEMRV